MAYIQPTVGQAVHGLKMHAFHCLLKRNALGGQVPYLSVVSLDGHHIAAQ